MPSLLEEEISGVIAKFQYPDAKSFRELIEALAKILDEARFTITRDGIRVVGMDVSKTALIEITIPYEAFLEYEISEDREEVYLGVHLGSLASMLKKGKKGEPVTFLVAEDRVLVKVDSSIVKKFLVPNIEVLLDVPGEIKLDFNVEASVVSDALKKALRDVEVVGDIVEFEATEERLVIRAKGEGRSRAETIFTTDSVALTYLDVKEPSSSAYDVQYLKNVLNLTKIAESVDIKFSTDKPLELVFKSPEGSRVRYLLAPAAI
jgi:proliferating cell nuclear antigen